MRAKRKLRVGLVAAAAITALVLAGCGGGSGTGETAGGATEGAATSNAKVPKTLKVVLGLEFDTLYPPSSIVESDWMVNGLYSGTLTKYGEETHGALELAESLKPSSNYTKWTATLKPGLKFSDGTPITGKDVAESFQFEIEQEGLPFGKAPNMTSAKATGPRTAVISFSSPEPNFPAIASIPGFGVFPAASLEKEGEAFFAHPISAGPYVVDSFNVRHVTMSANPHYSGTKPGPEKVEFNVVEDAGTRLSEVKTGQANYAFDLPEQMIPQITDPAELQVQEPAGNFQILMNNKDKVLSDKRIRRAINFALDREALSEIALGGEARPNSRYWPEVFKKFSDAEAGEQQGGADIAAAERELKGTACESGCELSLIGRSSAPWMQPLLLVIQQQLEAVGIKVNVKTVDSTTTYEEEEKGEFQMIVDTFLAVVPAEEVLTAVNFRPGPPLNAAFTNFESKKAEELVSELVETPLAKRGPVAKEIGDLFAEEVPWADIADLVFINASNLPESVVHGEVYELKVE